MLTAISFVHFRCTGAKVGSLCETNHHHSVPLTAPILQLVVVDPSPVMVLVIFKNCYSSECGIFSDITSLQEPLEYVIQHVEHHSQSLCHI